VAWNCKPYGRANFCRRQCRRGCDLWRGGVSAGQTFDYQTTPYFVVVSVSHPYFGFRPEDEGPGNHHGVFGNGVLSRPTQHQRPDGRIHYSFVLSLPDR